MLLCCVDLYVEAVLTTLGPGIFDWEAAGGGSSRETSVRQGRASSACQPQAQPVFPAGTHVRAIEGPASCPGMRPGRGPSLLRAIHPFFAAHPARLKTQRLGEFIFRKWGVDAHQRC